MSKALPVAIQCMRVILVSLAALLTYGLVMPHNTQAQATIQIPIELPNAQEGGCATRLNEHTGGGDERDAVNDSSAGYGHMQWVSVVGDPLDRDFVVEPGQTVTLQLNSALFYCATVVQNSQISPNRWPAADAVLPGTLTTYNSTHGSSGSTGPYNDRPLERTTYIHGAALNRERISVSSGDGSIGGISAPSSFEVNRNDGTRYLIAAPLTFTYTVPGNLAEGEVRTVPIAFNFSAQYRFDGGSTISNNYSLNIPMTFVGEEEPKYSINGTKRFFNADGAEDGTTCGAATHTISKASGTNGPDVFNQAGKTFGHNGYTGNTTISAPNEVTCSNGKTYALKDVDARSGRTDNHNDTSPITPQSTISFDGSSLVTNNPDDFVVTTLNDTNSFVDVWIYYEEISLDITLTCGVGDLDRIGVDYEFAVPSAMNARIQYRELGTTSWAIAQDFGPGTYDDTVTITGLIENKSYEVRAQIRNGSNVVAEQALLGTNACSTTPFSTVRFSVVTSDGKPVPVTSVVGVHNGKNAKNAVAANGDYKSIGNCDQPHPTQGGDTKDVKIVNGARDCRGFQFGTEPDGTTKLSPAMKVFLNEFPANYNKATIKRVDTSASVPAGFRRAPGPASSCSTAVQFDYENGCEIFIRKVPAADEPYYMHLRITLEAFVAVTGNITATCTPPSSVTFSFSLSHPDWTSTGELPTNMKVQAREFGSGDSWDTEINVLPTNGSLSAGTWTFSDTSGAFYNSNVNEARLSFGYDHNDNGTIEDDEKYSHIQFRTDPPFGACDVNADDCPTFPGPNATAPKFTKDVTLPSKTSKTGTQPTAGSGHTAPAGAVIDRDDVANGYEIISVKDEHGQDLPVLGTNPGTSSNSVDYGPLIRDYPYDKHTPTLVYKHTFTRYTYTVNSTGPSSHYHSATCTDDIDDPDNPGSTIEGPPYECGQDATDNYTWTVDEDPKEVTVSGTITADDGNGLVTLDPCYHRSFLPDVELTSKPKLNNDRENPTNATASMDVSIDFLVPYPARGVGTMREPSQVNNVAFRFEYNINGGSWAPASIVSATGSPHTFVETGVAYVENETLNNVQTEVAVSVPNELKPGDVVCFKATVGALGLHYVNLDGDVRSGPAGTAGSGSFSGESIDEDCTNRVENWSYFKVFGNDVMAGGQTGSCSTNAGVGLQSDYRSDSYGSTIQYAAFVLGNDSSVPTAGLRHGAGQVPLPNSGLTFANTSASGNNFGGGFGGGITSACVPNYFGAKDDKDLALLDGSGSATARGTKVRNAINNSPNSAPVGIEYYELPTGAGAATPGGSITIQNGTRKVVYIDGTLQINGNIIMSESWTDKKDVPYLAIIARDIVIDSNVTRIDGLYIAQSSNSSNGRIFTCNRGTQSGALYDDCNNQLVINGALIADQVHLLRTFGSLRDTVGVQNEGYLGANANPPSGALGSGCGTEGGSAVSVGSYTTGSTCAAEVINFLPNLYIPLSDVLIPEDSFKFDSYNIGPPNL